MTEQEWLASENPTAMLTYLREHANYDKIDEFRTQVTKLASDRKLRLFACACCRQVWDGTPCGACSRLGGHRQVHRVGEHAADMPWRECGICHGSGVTGGLTDPRSQKAVEVAERFADGLATEPEMLAAAREAGNARRESGVTPFDANPDQRKDMLLLAAANCCQPPAAGAASEVSRLIQQEVSFAVQASLLRDIFAPFVVREGWRTCGKCGGKGWMPAAIGRYSDSTDCPVCHGKGRVPSSQLTRWLAWHDGCVGKLAQAIYDERRFNDMPLLADALEEAGCEDATILGHCRGSGPHVRGCWVIDLLLGKE